MSSPTSPHGFFRGLRTFFIGLGVVVAFIVVVGLVVAYAALQEAKPFIEQEYPTIVYEHDEACSTPCSTLALEEMFGPAAGARQLRLDLNGAVAVAGGTAHVTIKDPDAKLVFEKTYTGSTSARTIDDQAAWSPSEGAWTVTIQLTGFQGSLSIGIVSIGLPPGSL